MPREEAAVNYFARTLQRPRVPDQFGIGNQDVPFSGNDVLEVTGEDPSEISKVLIQLTQTAVKNSGETLFLNCNMARIQDLSSGLPKKFWSKLHFSDALDGQTLENTIANLPRFLIDHPQVNLIVLESPVSNLYCYQNYFPDDDDEVDADYVEQTPQDSHDKKDFEKQLGPFSVQEFITLQLKQMIPFVKPFNVAVIFSRVIEENYFDNDNEMDDRGASNDGDSHGKISNDLHPLVTKQILLREDGSFEINSQ